MTKTYTDWAMEIIEKVGTVGADRLMSALDTEIDKAKHPEDYSIEEDE